MSNRKQPTITKDTVPEGFTLSLALVDAVPVLLFAVAIVLLGIKASMSPLIILGGILCFIGGAIKVLWKVIVAVFVLLYWQFIVKIIIHVTGPQCIEHGITQTCGNRQFFRERTLIVNIGSTLQGLFPL